jgi:phage-related protein
MKTLLKDGIGVEGAMSVLADTFGGDAAAAADTASGRFKKLQIGLSETKESIGAALMPAIQALLPFVETLGNWAQEHTTVFLVVGGAIAGIATAILAVNLAMKAWTAATTAFTAVQAAFNAVLALNPIFLMVAAVVAVGAALVVLQMKFNIFGKALEAVGAVASALWDGIKAGFAGVVTAVSGYINGLVAVYKGLFNGIASVWNNTVGKLSFKIPGWVPGIGGAGFDVPDIPMLANGGIVTSPTLALIGEKGPEAVVPLSRGGGYGETNVTIQVNGGDPQQVVNALRRYMQTNGSIPIRVSA